MVSSAAGGTLPKNKQKCTQLLLVKMHATVKELLNGLQRINHSSQILYYARLYLFQIWRELVDK